MALMGSRASPQALLMMQEPVHERMRKMDAQRIDVEALSINPYWYAAERDLARRLLDPVLKHMIAAVHRYEGTVNQIMGDGIMALFGAPITHEDHAMRACYAALSLQEAMRRYRARRCGARRGSRCRSESG